MKSNEKRDGKKIARVYKGAFWGSRLGYLGIILSLIWLCDHYWILLIVAILLGIAVLFLTQRMRNRIGMILARDLDAETYDEVMHLLNVPYLEGTYAGNYKEIYRLAMQILEYHDSPNGKDHALASLASMYYETGDLEKLRWTCDRVAELNQEKFSAKKQKTYGEIFTFYENYLSERFDDCKTFLQRRLDTIKKPHQELVRLRSEYGLALISYRQKNWQEAERGFRKVMEKAPRTHYKTLCAQYLEQISRGEEFSSKPLDVGAEEEVPTPENKPVKRKKIGIFWFIFVGLLVALACLSAYSHKKDRQNQWQEYVALAQSEGYKDVVPLADFDLVDQEGEFADYVFLFDTSDKGLVMGAIFYYVDDAAKTDRLGIICENISSDSLTFGTGYVSGHRIGARLYENKDDIPDYAYYSTKISVDGTTCWFVVEYMQQ